MSIHRNEGPSKLDQWYYRNYIPHRLRALIDVFAGLFYLVKWLVTGIYKLIIKLKSNAGK
jgi:hypothetical protein